MLEKQALHQAAQQPVADPSLPSPLTGAATGEGPFGFRSAHLVGIGGCGMSSIAWSMLACGVRVTGSDIQFSETCRALHEAGARIFTGHAADNVQDPEAIVVSSAIRGENPEVTAARARRIPILHRSEALGLFLKSRSSILITGTHGKTTTTAMAGYAFEGAGLDPWVFVGGRVADYNGNTRTGGLEWAVAEADESDGTFERLPADHLIVTNIEDDHLDYWGHMEAMMEGYRRVCEAAASGAILMLNADDPGALALQARLERPVRTFSVGGALAEYDAVSIVLRAAGSEFTFRAGGRALCRVRLSVPGMHNVSNATAVLGLTHALGADVEAAAERLAAFRGVGRRFDHKGTVNGIQIIDDYAHHPTEIQATIAAARLLKEQAGGRLVAAFQPHRYTRTRDQLDEFSESFDGADLLVLTDVYAAGEDPIPGATTEALVAKVEARGRTPLWLIPSREEIAPRLAAELRPGDVVLTLGAGTITRTGNELLLQLTELFSRRGDR